MNINELSVNQKDSG